MSRLQSIANFQLWPRTIRPAIARALDPESYSELDAHREERRRDDMVPDLLSKAGLTEVLQELDKTQTPYTITLLDGDRFKKINDTYGHLVGDQKIVHIGNLINQVVRSTDVVGARFRTARFGGDEYVIVMPNLAANDIPLVMGRIGSAIQASPMRIQHNGQDVEIAIRLSAGVATKRPGESYEETFARADANMYAAKADRGQELSSEARLGVYIA